MIDYRTDGPHLRLRVRHRKTRRVNLANLSNRRRVLMLLLSHLVRECSCASTLCTDAGHVRAVLADYKSAFAAGFSCFARIKFVSTSAEVSGLSAFTCDGSLFGGVHRCEPAKTRSSR